MAAGARRSSPPAVAARLAAWEPTRVGTTPESAARKELLIADSKARKAAIAAAHNARVNLRSNHTAQQREQMIEYRKTSIDRRLEKGSAIRQQNLSAVKAKANKTVSRVAKAAERLDERKAALASAIDRALEAASEKRKQQLRAVQFKAHNETAKVKSIAKQAELKKTTLAAKIDDQLELASQKRAAILNARSRKAAVYNDRHLHGVQRAKNAELREAKQLASKLESKMAAAEYLHDLATRLRQSKAALINEHAQVVLSRRRLSDAISPILKSAQIKAQQYFAETRRTEAMSAVQEKAGKFVQRAVHVCAIQQMKNEEHQQQAKINLETKLAAASARKEEYVNSRGASFLFQLGLHRGGAMSPSPRKASPRMNMGADRPHSAPTSPVCGMPAC